MLSGDVSNDQEHAVFLRRSPWPWEKVIVVARDCVGGPRHVGDGHAGNLWRHAGQRPGLNFFGNFKIAFHDHAVRHFEHQHNEEKQSAEEMQIDLDASFSARLIAEAETATGEEQHDQRGQQQHPARRS